MKSRGSILKIFLNCSKPTTEMSVDVREADLDVNRCDGYVFQKSLPDVW